MSIIRDYLIPVSGLHFQDQVANIWSPQPGVMLDPSVQFGEPCIHDTRIPTRATCGPGCLLVAQAACSLGPALGRRMNPACGPRRAHPGPRARSRPLAPLPHVSDPGSERTALQTNLSSAQPASCPPHRSW